MTFPDAPQDPFAVESEFAASPVAPVEPAPAAPVATPTGTPVAGTPTATPSAGGAPAAIDPRRLQLLREVELGISVELGRSRMTVREVLGLAPGAVVELDRPAGSPVDVLVNGTLMARGEVVVVDDEYAVRITEVVSSDPAVGLGA
ncbi:flagellar motor switch protein FliN [Phycicoccus sonneratiae]|uniref:Flagellar motor switch protein FliN n=1 Tax=Phycicoccus sonneratiae TaxID=2807628 RepID=A0ABS2CNJ6_9MICO|nr:flagellar motor switch protein FliN [Phycicoccus sonneraticus]MBM6401450.1 flagellar motor switch protein FliN [Phycicoccus sonneraticus]